MLCCDVLCYVMLRYVMLFHFILLLAISGTVTPIYILYNIYVLLCLAVQFEPACPVVSGLLCGHLGIQRECQLCDAVLVGRGAVYPRGVSRDGCVGGVHPAVLLLQRPAQRDWGGVVRLELHAVGWLRHTNVSLGNQCNAINTV
jgi:hypothetical protein